MNAGSLTTRIAIEAHGSTRDAAGQPVPTNWITVRTLWASVRHKSGTETIKADQPISAVQASVRIRWRTDIDASMRVRIGSAIYSIAAVLPDRQRREFVDLVCEQVAGRG